LSGLAEGVLAQWLLWIPQRQGLRELEHPYLSREAGFMSDYSGDKFVSARLAFSEDKVLKAETPMVIWHTHSWPGMAAHLTEPPLEGTGGGSGVGTPVPQPEQYVAVCEALHGVDVLGALPNGTWAGNVVDNLRDACNEAAAHEDGQAHVAIYLGSHLVAVSCQ
jgi:hypothetical protein